MTDAVIGTALAVLLVALAVVLMIDRDMTRRCLESHCREGRPFYVSGQCLCANPTEAQ